MASRAGKMITSRAGWAMAILVLTIGPSLAQDACKAPKIEAGKPWLAGEVNDQARDIGLVWRSGAIATGGTEKWWSIVNAVCNNGRAPLVVSWPKAAIYVSAFAPLPSGKSVINQFDVGALEPETNVESPLEYGLARGRTIAQVYSTPSSEKRISALRSYLSASFDNLGQVELLLEASPKGDGYQFSIVPKSPTARSLRVAIASSQSRTFNAAAQKAGILAGEIFATEFAKAPDLGSVLGLTGC
jgi:hypothetical protein